MLTVPHPFRLTNIHTVNESSSGSKPYIGGCIWQNACPSGMKTNNIQVQLLLTPGPFLASRHQDNSILRIFLTSPPYIPFFSPPQPNPPRNRWTNSVKKKKKRRVQNQKDPTEIMGWTEEKNNTAFLHRATAKSEKLKLVHSITEMGGPPETTLSHPRRCFFFPLTERDFVALTFLTECTQLPSRHATSLLVLQPSLCRATLPQYYLALHNSNTKFYFTPPHYFARPGALPKKVPFWKQH